MKTLIVIILVAAAIIAIYLFSKDWKRVWQIARGYGLYSLWAWFCDGPVWLAVIAISSNFFGDIKGVAIGSAIMTASAIINNLLFLVYYQKRKKDWLGVDTFESICNDVKGRAEKWFNKTKNHRNPFVMIFSWVGFYTFSLAFWALKKNKLTMFFALSILEDSFVTTAFIRGKVGGKLTGKDYVIFVLSTLVGCTYWSIRNGAIYGGAITIFDWISWK